MSNPAEIERGITRVRSMLQQANTLVWQHSSFPKEDRPDVGSLLGKINVKENEGDAFWNFHPSMKPKVVSTLVRQARQAETESMRNEAAWHNWVTGEITFAPSTAATPSDAKLRRIVMHEAVTSVFNAPHFILPSDYTPYQEELVKAKLRFLFESRRRPAFKDTRVVRNGFNQLMFVGDYFVSSICSGGDLDEVYPTIGEIITDQIIRRRGDIEGFDRDAEAGLLRMVEVEDHPNFAKVLFESLKLVDWRDILFAFRFLSERQDAPEAMMRMVDQRLGGLGNDIVNALYTAMEKDEGAINMVNESLSRTLHLRRLQF